MSAVATDFVYTVYGKKDPDRAEPALDKEKLDAMKAEFDKYFSGDQK